MSLTPIKCVVCGTKVDGHLHVRRGTCVEDLCGLDCLFAYAQQQMMKKYPVSTVGGELEEEIEYVVAALRGRVAETITAARKAGKYGFFTWGSETLMRQALRGMLHLQSYIAKKEGDFPPDTKARGGESTIEEELGHCITRLGFLCALETRVEAAVHPALKAKGAAKPEFQRSEPGKGSFLEKHFFGEKPPIESEACAGTLGARLIAEERRRQIKEEHHDVVGDNTYTEGQLVNAALAYLMRLDSPLIAHPPPCWPWEAKWWKPKSRRRDLVKAGALIAAEIDRLERAERREGAKG